MGWPIIAPIRNEGGFISASNRFASAQFVDCDRLRLIAMPGRGNAPALEANPHRLTTILHRSESSLLDELDPW
jgi:hypothetical protein